MPHADGVPSECALSRSFSPSATSQQDLRLLSAFQQNGFLEEKYGLFAVCSSSLLDLRFSCFVAVLVAVVVGTTAVAAAPIALTAAGFTAAGVAAGSTAAAVQSAVYAGTCCFFSLRLVHVKDLFFSNGFLDFRRHYGCVLQSAERWRSGTLSCKYVLYSCVRILSRLLLTSCPTAKAAIFSGAGAAAAAATK